MKLEANMIKKLEKFEDFEKIIKEDKNVVVDFNAVWCGPCRMMGRVIEDLEDEFKDITFLKVDTDEFPTIAQQFFIVSIPSILAFKDGTRINFTFNGQEKDMQIGSMDEDDFASMLKETF